MKNDSITIRMTLAVLAAVSLTCGIACSAGSSTGGTDGGTSGTSGGTSGSSGTSGTSGTSGSSGKSGGGACGLSIVWKKDNDICNAWMDSHCCSQEQACAANTTCATFISCVNACVIPRQDACLSACGTNAPQGLADIGACSKQTQPAGMDIPSGCEYP